MCKFQYIHPPVAVVCQAPADCIRCPPADYPLSASRLYPLSAYLLYLMFAILLHLLFVSRLPPSLLPPFSSVLVIPTPRPRDIWCPRLRFDILSDVSIDILARNKCSLLTYSCALARLAVAIENREVTAICKLYWWQSEIFIFILFIRLYKNINKIIFTTKIAMNVWMPLRG